MVRRLCDDCKKEIKPKPKIKELILKKIETLPPEVKKDLKISKTLTLWTNQGCQKCANSGFTGRIGVFEILSMTDSLADIILKRPSEAEIAKEGEKQGMITMEQDGILKVLAGLTTIEEILRVTEEK